MHCGRGHKYSMTIKEGHALCTRSIGTLQHHILHRQLPGSAAVNSAPQTAPRSHIVSCLCRTGLLVSHYQDCWVSHITSGLALTFLLCRGILILTVVDHSGKLCSITQLTWQIWFRIETLFLWKYCQN